MSSTPSPTPPADGALARLVARAAAGAARRPKRMIAAWLLLVAACLVAGGMAGTKQLTDTQAGTGQSRTADERIDGAGLTQPATESVLVRSDSTAATAAAAKDLQTRLARLPQVATVQGPAGAPERSTAGGRVVLVQAHLRGDPDDAGDHVAPIERAVAATERAHAGTSLDQAGDGSVGKAIEDVVGNDLGRAEMLSLPITLVILVLAFGAVVAALVPLLLGVTSVAAALGALGVVSQFSPTSDATATVIVLIGLAVGVDYSLFYVRREREERRKGRGPDAALHVAAATVGRAVLVSGLTVLVALAGLLFTGLSVFSSMAVATMLVALIAVIGSLTVLPAVLALLGGRIDRGRIPLLWRLARRRAGRAGLWARVAGAVTARPRAALVVAVCVLASLAVPALGMHTANPGASDLRADNPVRVAQRHIERSFPGAPDEADLVVTGTALGTGHARGELAALGDRAARVTGGDGTGEVRVARDGRTAVVSVPMPDRGVTAQRDAVHDLREQVAPTASRVGPGARVLVTGHAAQSADFTHQLGQTTPIVIGFVLLLAFGLLLAAFRSPALAAAVIGLNLLSVGAAYGVLVVVFQHHWAEDLLGFTSNGAIVDWLPLFAFVILFGLSMDYTVLVLERIREARRAGRTAREAAAEGVAATGGTVTSAAVVMVAVFAVFATLRLLEFKQFGLGLAAAILIDATLVRGVALPAVVALLGERRWRVPRRRARRSRELAPAAGWGT
jgi:uncharacterized membrane protein YdfJ with MMPL/SSD domain